MNTKDLLDLFRPMAEQIKEFDLQLERQEEWRKAQAIPKAAYRPRPEDEENGD